jgi:hypothetical protein
MKLVMKTHDLKKNNNEGPKILGKRFFLLLLKCSSLYSNKKKRFKVILLKLCLFPGIYFPENHFPNFSVFV